MAQEIWRHPDWGPTEAPRIAGSPATLDHAMPVRIGYVLIGIVCALAGNLGNGLITANLAQIQGNLHLTPAQGQWLVGAYAMMNCSANLLLFKFRIQFGIRLFALLSLIAYAALCILQIFVDDFSTAVLTRGASGLAASPLFAMTTLYFIQAAGQKHLFNAAMIGLTMPQIITPMAFLIVPGLNDLASPALPYLLETGLALLALALVVAFPLPYGVRAEVFERADIVTLALFIPGLALLVGTLAQGSTQWWGNSPAIGLGLAGSVVLIMAGLAWEYGRANPMLFVRWLATGDVAFFVVGALIVRFLTAEQTTGAVGFLRSVGMGPDQLVPLYWVVLGGSIAGLATMVLVTRPTNAPFVIMAAVLLIAVGCLIDRDATPFDRPHDFYLSQTIISFASALFVGPLLLVGLQKVIRDGAQYVISFFAVFAFTQSAATILSSATLTTLQVVREHDASGVLTTQVRAYDPVVQQQLAAATGAAVAQNTDPALQAAQGAASLGQTATLNATTIAYNDMFSFIGAIAMLFAVTLVIRFIVAQRKQKRDAA